MKKILSLFLSFALLLTLFCIPAYADKKPSSLNEVEISKENAYYDESLGAYVVSFTLNSDNTLNYLTKSEVNALNTEGNTLNSSNTNISELPNTDEDSLSILADYYEYYKFVKTSGPVKYVGTRRKVSADFEAPPAGGSVSKSVSFTISATYSAGVTTSAQKSAIQANAGFSWNVSATASTTYTANLSAGQTGYLAFTPYYNKVSGNLQLYSNWDGLISSTSATGYSVMKTYDGEPDGLYQFILY